jgi:hypothetical protein
LVGAVTEVVKATFRICKKTTGCGAHAVAIGAFDDAGCGRKSSASNRVVLGPGPEAENDEIGFLGLPPDWVADFRVGRPEDGKFGRFRISDFGMRKRIWGVTWFGR